MNPMTFQNLCGSAGMGVKNTSDNERSSSTYYSESKPKRKKHKLPSIETNLKKLICKLRNNEVTEFNSRPKNIKKCFKNNSKRRSQFIGVSKNGNSWQVLINVRNQKKYIGGYTKEKDAAISYDFYTIALRGAEAKTNFNYDKDLVLEMIDAYYANGNTFRPAPFVSRVQDIIHPSQVKE